MPGVNGGDAVLAQPLDQPLPVGVQAWITTAPGWTAFERSSWSWSCSSLPSAPASPTAICRRRRARRDDLRGEGAVAVQGMRTSDANALDLPVPSDQHNHRPGWRARPWCRPSRRARRSAPRAWPARRRMPSRRGAGERRTEAAPHGGAMRNYADPALFGGRHAAPALAPALSFPSISIAFISAPPSPRGSCPVTRSRHSGRRRRRRSRAGRSGRRPDPRPSLKGTRGCRC